MDLVGLLAFDASGVLLLRGQEIVPALDLCEGAFGPCLDGIQEADEEVDDKGSDVDLVLGDVDAVDELLLYLAGEFEHLVGIGAARPASHWQPLTIKRPGVN